jgi:sulfur relay (sulfurtransferase) DsrF/TusC family protein
MINSQVSNTNNKYLQSLEDKMFFVVQDSLESRKWDEETKLNLKSSLINDQLINQLGLI